MDVKKTFLWLDDFRNPKDHIDSYDRYNVVWVKSHLEFVNWVNKNGLPDIVSFDHDLEFEHYGDPIPDYNRYSDDTGLDSAKSLVDYCYNRQLHLPTWYVHSANFHGRKNIETYLSNASKHLLIYESDKPE